MQLKQLEKEFPESWKISELLGNARITMDLFPSVHSLNVLAELLSPGS